MLTFGLSFTFVASFGQTFLISLFVPYFLEDFQLSNAAFGTIYSLLTLASAATLPWLGGGIDRLPLKRYSFLVAGGLLAASLLLAFSWHVSVFVTALLLLRLSGQGLSGHTALTAMARHFTVRRGKALSIAGLGYPLGEAVFPLLIAGLLTVFGWREIWLIFAGIIAFGFIPFLAVVLNRLPEKKDGQRVAADASGLSDRSDRSKKSNKSDKSGNTGKGHTVPFYRKLVSDLRFWLLVPAVLLPSFWVTALFLYQIALAGQLGWTPTLLATAFTAFAVARVASSLGSGPLIDRWSAATLFPYHVLPLGAGMAVAWFHPGNWSAFLYMGLMGLTLGAGSPVKSALWAERYGEEVIGRVRSLFATLMVVSSALSPALVGWLLDHDISMETILAWAVASVALGSLLAFLSFRDGIARSP